MGIVSVEFRRSDYEVIKHSVRCVGLAYVILSLHDELILVEVLMQ